MGRHKGRNPLLTLRSCAQIDHKLPDHIVRELPLKTQHLGLRHPLRHRLENRVIAPAMYPFAVKKVGVFAPLPSYFARMAFRRAGTSEGYSPHQLSSGVAPELREETYSVLPARLRRPYFPQ